MTMDQLPETPEELSEPSPAAPPTPQDIDPSQWLSASVEVVTGFIDTKAGRLKIAALTEEESEGIRKKSEAINPANPKGPRIVNLKKMRLNTVAASINKAYGYTPASPQFLTAEALNKALTGEITMIVNKITELSGYMEDDQGRTPSEFFSFS